MLERTILAQCMGRVQPPSNTVYLLITRPSTQRLWEDTNTSRRLSPLPPRNHPTTLLDFPGRRRNHNTLHRSTPARPYPTTWVLISRIILPPIKRPTYNASLRCRMANRDTTTKSELMVSLKLRHLRLDQEISPITRRLHRLAIISMKLTIRLRTALIGQTLFRRNLTQRLIHLPLPILQRMIPIQLHNNTLTLRDIPSQTPTITPHCMRRC